ncbi:MAG: DNA-deoxyinosine glycosylase [Xanthomonadales bacterium]|nr:DNA-deoxyinosine glycosylase [Xanthomonadales bacterium]
MELSQGFPPVSKPDARVLILGSMPGKASLEATEYYAFPRNAFWHIMGELFGAGPELDYRSRLRKLTSRQVALWDVIGKCHRRGSLDSAIIDDGLKTNEFAVFFKQHPHISHVFFNGQTANRLFTKNVRPGLAGNLVYHTLPSTSPAHATKSFAEKLEAWSVIKDYLLR